MQIENINNNQNLINGRMKNNNEINNLSTLKNEKFDSMLAKGKENISENNNNTQLNEMIKNVEDLKQSLDYEITVENLNKYKEAVQDFLNYYTRNELKMEDYILRDNKGYQKKLSIIKSVDEKINNLNGNMLESPLGHMETLKQIGEINGLIVNLLL